MFTKLRLLFRRRKLPARNDASTLSKLYEKARRLNSRAKAGAYDYVKPVRLESITFHSGIANYGRFSVIMRTLVRIFEQAQERPTAPAVPDIIFSEISKGEYITLGDFASIDSSGDYVYRIGELSRLLSEEIMDYAKDLRQRVEEDNFKYAYYERVLEPYHASLITIISAVQKLS